VTRGRGDKETVPGQGDCSRTWRHGDGTEVERWLLSFSPNQVETRERQGDTGKGDNETVPGQGDCSRTRRHGDGETRRWKKRTRDVLRDEGRGTVLRQGDTGRGDKETVPGHGDTEMERRSSGGC